MVSRHDGYTSVPQEDPHTSDVKEAAASGTHSPGALALPNQTLAIVSKTPPNFFQAHKTFLCATAIIWGPIALAFGVLIVITSPVWVPVTRLIAYCAIDRTLKSSCNNMKKSEEDLKLDSFRNAIENKRYYGKKDSDDLRSFGEILTEKMAPEHAVQLAPIINKIKQLADVKNPKNSAETNREILLQLRAAITSDAYQNYKEDPNVLAIDFIQMVALSLYNTEALDAYHDLGKQILGQTEKQNKPPTAEKESDAKSEESLIGWKTAAQLEASHRVCSQKLFTDQGAAKITYAVAHPEQAMASMASEGGGLRSIVKVVGRDRYDSHNLELPNNPSLQGTMKWNQGNNVVTVQNVYGGTPTIGDTTIFPELEAILDAIDANNKLPADQQNPKIPHKFIYTNFQDINRRHGEGPRSKTIMELAKKYPNSFQAITLPKDSPFYLAACTPPEEHALNDKTSLAYRFHNTPPTIEEFGKEMLARMLDDSSFRLKDRMPALGSDSGFYFSRYKKDETIIQCKARWTKSLTEITKNATAFFQEAEKHAEDPESKMALRAAYTEYVYSMIQGLYEAETAGKLIGAKQVNPRIMAIRACKENIDRGGAENVKYMYTRIDHEALRKSGKDPLELLVGAFHSRALSTRDRVILPKRTAPLMAFIRHVEPDEFREQQSQLLGKLGMSVQHYSFTPKLKDLQLPEDKEILKHEGRGEVRETDKAKMHRERNEIRHKMGLQSLKPGKQTAKDLEALKPKTKPMGRLPPIFEDDVSTKRK